MKNYKEITTSIIKELGIPASLTGYHYVRYAIELMINDITIMTGISKILYPAVAKEFNTTSARVERAIRNAIEVGWERGNIELINKLFSYSFSANKGKPTNGEFIVTVADYVLITDHPTEKGGAE